MTERIQSNLLAARDAIQADHDGMPADERRALVAIIIDSLVCDKAVEDHVLTDLVDLLARDPDWSVRLEVARMIHLLGDETCSHYVAHFRGDDNRYVRSHAERSLARLRKARQTTQRHRTNGRVYADDLDQFTRQYGKRATATLCRLVDQRYAMLAASVAHDVRGVLTTLTANAAALAEELPSECVGRCPGAARVASIRDDVGFLTRTIEAMEQYSAEVPVTRQPESIRELIDRAIEKARAGVVQQGHDPSRVEINTANVPSLQVRVSRQLMVLALTNVIENAMEAFADRDVDALRPGRVEVAVIVDGYETRILVTDTGPGIEPEVLASLRTFTPTGPNKAKRSSSGWGLSLVHKYVTAHGGAVTIESAMERGTTVVMVLPMREPSEGDDT